jgi:hypothetical protein
VRVFNAILIVLATLGLMFLGCLILATTFSETAHNIVFESWQAYEVALDAHAWLRAAGLGFGVFLILASWASLWGNVIRRRIERTVVFHNPHGEVNIALGALEDLGKVVKAEIPGAKEIKLRVVARRKGLQVTARVSLWSDANLPKATQEIQEAVRQYLQEIVGTDQEIRPRVVVSKVAFRGGEDLDSGVDVQERPRRARRPVV